MQHGTGAVYQDQVHVPLIIKYPGQHEAYQYNALTSQVDLMPTVLDVAGISAPSGIQGRTLRLPPPPENTYAVYSQAVAINYLRRLSPRFQGVRRAIFVGSRKLITWTQGPPELYDLAADPDETNNLYRADDPHAKALADRLSAWAASAPREFEAPGKLDKDSVEKLKSLGYAQ
jgi:arylsulfatase A-like enzyme